MDLPVRRTLLGRDHAVTRRYLAVALVLFAGTLAAMAGYWALARVGVALPVDGAVLLWLLASVVVGVPTAHAYRNDGLVVCLALGVAIPLAFYLVVTTFALVRPTESPLWGLWTALTFGVPAGLLGFLLGAGGRWLERQAAHYRRGREVL